MVTAAIAPAPAERKRATRSVQGAAFPWPRSTAWFWNLGDRLFTPERLSVVLEAFIARSADADTNRRVQLAQARRAFTEVEGGVSRLLELVERGLIDLSDPSLNERLDSARLARQAAGERVRLLDGAAMTGSAKITSEKPDALATALRTVMREGDPAFRKAYLRLFVDQVMVGDEDIRMRGPTEALEGGEFGRASARWWNGAPFCSAVASPAGFEPPLPP